MRIMEKTIKSNNMSVLADFKEKHGISEIPVTLTEVFARLQMEVSGMELATFEEVQQLTESETDPSFCCFAYKQTENGDTIVVIYHPDMVDFVQRERDFSRAMKYVHIAMDEEATSEMKKFFFEKLPASSVLPERIFFYGSREIVRRHANDTEFVCLAGDPDKDSIFGVITATALFVFYEKINPEKQMMKRLWNAIPDGYSVPRAILKNIISHLSPDMTYKFVFLPDTRNDTPQKVANFLGYLAHKAGYNVGNIVPNLALENLDDGQDTLRYQNPHSSNFLVDIDDEKVFAGLFGNTVDVYLPESYKKA